MLSICTLYYLMTIKHISVARIIVIMKLLITTKAGAKHESSTASIKKGKSFLDCMARSLSKQMCHADITLKVRQDTLGIDMFLLHCISMYCLTVTTYLRLWTTAYQFSDLTTSQIHGTRKTTSVKWRRDKISRSCIKLFLYRWGKLFKPKLYFILRWHSKVTSFFSAATR